MNKKFVGSLIMVFIKALHIHFVLSVILFLSFAYPPSVGNAIKGLQ